MRKHGVKRSRLGLCVWIAVLALCSGLSGRTLPQADALTFGALLVAGSDKISQIIREAQEAGRGIAITAAIQAQNTISQAGVVYEAALDKTFVKLNDQQKQAYLDIQGLIAQFEHGAAAVTEQVGQRAQLVANSLPLSRRYPQLARVTPLYLVPGQAVYRIRLEGNFPYTFDNRTTPVAVIGENRYRAVDYGTLGVTFEIPSSVLNAPTASAIGHTSAVIMVPWNNSKWFHLGLFKKIENARYAFDLPALPANAAAVELTSQVDNPEVVEEWRHSQEWLFDSSQDDIERTECFTLSEEDRRAGWRIIANRVEGQVTQVIEGEENSDWYNRGQRDTNDVTACWRFRTEHHAFDDDGKIRWRIRARVKRTVARPQPETERGELGWSTSRVFTPRSTDWQLRITRFDGTVRELRNSDLSSDLVQVVVGGGVVTVRTFGNP